MLSVVVWKQISINICTNYKQNRCTQYKSNSSMFFLVISILFILLLLGGFILILKLPSKLKYRKIGVGVACIVIVVLLFTPAFFLFEDLFFTKSDAKVKLEEHGIFLLDKFEMDKSNISGIIDYTLQFKLSISAADKSRIIRNFMQSPYLIKVNKQEMYDIRSVLNKEIKNDTSIYAIYEEDNFWNFQYCKKIRNGYIQTWDIIQISKNKNELNFIRNE